MNLYFRLLQTLWACFRTRHLPRISALEEVALTLRCWPNDLDLNLHMNNGRYLTLMDLGRTQLMSRMGLLRIAIRKRWFPVLGGARVHFARPIGSFQRFELKTRMLAWDEKWFYIEQVFVADGKVCAAARVRGLFLSPEGRLPPARLLEALGDSTVSPAIPVWDAG